MKLIKIKEDHYVVVDETIQPVNGYYYDDFIKAIRNTNGAEYGEASHCWQITHSTNIDWNEVYYIPLQEVKELIGEVDVEKKARKVIPTPMSGTEYIDEIKGFVKGYNQALEDKKEKKYTEEDLRKAIKMSFDGSTFKEITQSLQPKTEWEVEWEICETYRLDECNSRFACCNKPKKLKIII